MCGCLAGPHATLREGANACQEAAPWDDGPALRAANLQKRKKPPGSKKAAPPKGSYPRPSSSKMPMLSSCCMTCRGIDPLARLKCDGREPLFFGPPARPSQPKRDATGTKRCQALLGARFEEPCHSSSQFWHLRASILPLIVASRWHHAPYILRNAPTPSPPFR